MAAFSPENLERVAPLVETLREIAAAHDATPAQVALAWVVHHSNVIAIPGASSVEQLEHNAAAGDLELDPAEVARLTEAAEAYDPVDRLTALQGQLKRLVGSSRR